MKTMLRVILVLAISLCQVFCYSCGPYAKTSLKKKDTVVVCIEYDNLGNGTASAFGRFHPEVDVLAQYEVDEKKSGALWNSAWNSMNASKVRARVGTMTTPWVSLINVNGNSQADFFTLMINIDDGKLKSINWDNNCVCDQCYESQCHTSCSAATCDAAVKVYAVWTGTDSDSTVMLSASNRYSELSKYSTKKMFDNMKATANSYCDNGACDVDTSDVRL